VDRQADDVLLTWDDPGVPGVAWNVYRDPQPNRSSWGPPHAGGVGDEEPGTSGIQYRDVGAATGGSAFFYVITAVDACGESPLLPD
jgi:hypothetical protein